MTWGGKQSCPSFISLPFSLKSPFKLLQRECVLLLVSKLDRKGVVLCLTLIISWQGLSIITKLTESSPNVPKRFGLASYFASNWILL